MTKKTPSLQSKTASGVFWTFLEQFGRRGIGVFFTIFLARFLTPDDYGLIATVSVFFAFANALMDAGFRQALIRKKDATQADYATIFYTNITLGLLAYGLLFFSAHAIADFYTEPRLISLVRIVGLVVVINSLQLVQIVDLTRRLDFKTQFKVTVPASIISGSVAIILAMSGAGVWSLVTQMLLSPILITVSLWRFNRWYPTLEFSTESFKELFGFSSKMFLANLSESFFTNIYVIIIAKFFSPTLTGYYFFSTKICGIIREQFFNSIRNVAFPALATLQDENDRLRNGSRKLLQASVYLVFPAMIFLGSMSYSLFLLLFDPKWLPAVPYLQLLCVAELVYPLHAVNISILLVKGRSDLILYLEVAKKTLIICVLLISTRFGITAILIGQICISFLSYLPNSYFSAKLINYGAKEQIKDIFPSFFAALFGGAAALIAGNTIAPLKSPLITLLLQIPIAFIVYYLASRIMKIKIQETIIELVQEKFSLLISRQHSIRHD